MFYIKKFCYKTLIWNYIAWIIPLLCAWAHHPLGRAQVIPWVAFEQIARLYTRELRHGLKNIRPLTWPASNNVWCVNRFLFFNKGTPRKDFAGPVCSQLTTWPPLPRRYLLSSRCLQLLLRQCQCTAAGPTFGLHDCKSFPDHYLTFLKLKCLLKVQKQYLHAVRSINFSESALYPFVFPKISLP